MTTLRDGPDKSDWPLYGLIDDIRPALQEMFDGGQSGAIITLVAADGPSPRPIGSQMLITNVGLAAGYVSGGCIENSLELIAQDVIRSKVSRRVSFGSNSDFIDVQLTCGTRIETIIEPILPEDPTWRALLGAMSRRTSMVRLLQGNGTALLSPAAEKSQSIQLGDGTISYSRLYQPRTRLVVVGSDPVALATLQIAKAASFETHLARALGPKLVEGFVVDHYSTNGALNLLDGAVLDPWTAVVTTTHDADQDHEVLLQALPSQAFYVGVLGSKRGLPKRLERLRATGVSPSDIKRLRAPVGININAATPYEIAISIIADIIAHARNPAGTL
jgi:xanthine dehydrogenase accessory factor